MRLIPIMAVVAGVIMLRTAAPLYIANMRPGLTHTISETCKWSPRSWTRILGYDAPPGENAASERILWNCQHGRGQMSHSPFVKIILPVWPSASQRQAWDETDEDRDPLFAEGQSSNLIR